MNPSDCDHPSNRIKPAPLDPRYGLCHLCGAAVDRIGRFTVGDRVRISRGGSHHVGRGWQVVEGVIKRINRRYQGQRMYAVRIASSSSRSGERVVSVW